MSQLLLKLKVSHGEYQFTQLAILHAPHPDKADEVAQRYAKTFYGNPDQPREGEGYYFHGGEIHVAIQSITELSGADAETLRRFL